MFCKPDKNTIRKNRHRRIRQRISGSPDRPRLVVFRSLKHIYAQIVDDSVGHTLVSASSLDKDFNAYGGNIAAAKSVGSTIAKKALDMGIKSVVFDRSGYIFHGRVSALAQAARDAGLIF